MMNEFKTECLITVEKCGEEKGMKAKGDLNLLLCSSSLHAVFVFFTFPHTCMQLKHILNKYNTFCNKRRK